MDAQDFGEAVGMILEAPVVSPDRTPTRGLRRADVAALAVVVGLLLFAIRKVSAIGHPFFWGEDAIIFYLQDTVPGQDLFDSYAGQLWILQRMVAPLLGAAPSVPLTMTLYYLASVAITVLSCAVILQQRAAAVFVRFRFQLIGFAAIMLLPAVMEVHGNLANIHVWATISVMLCLSFPEPRTTWRKTAEGVWILVVALSGFTSAVLLPVAAWGLWRFRSRWAGVRAALIVLALTVAVAIWVTSDRPVATGGGLIDRILTAVESLPGRVGGALLAGEASGPNVPALLAIGLLLLVLVVALIEFGSPCLAWLACGMVWLLLGAFSVPLTAITQLLVPLTAGRYYTVLLAACLLTLIRGLASPTRLRYAAGLGLAAVLFGVVADFRLPTSPGFTDTEIQQVEYCAQSGDPLCDTPARPWDQP